MVIKGRIYAVILTWALWDTISKSTKMIHSGHPQLPLLIIIMYINIEYINIVHDYWVKCFNIIKEFFSLIDNTDVFFLSIKSILKVLYLNGTFIMESICCIITNID